MYTREQTKVVKNKNLSFGGNNKVLIQSMTTFKTSDFKNVINQIKKCEKNGANLMRVSILDNEDADAIKIIKKHVKIPIVADIHFDYKLALKCMDNGVDKIRINPGNIKNKDDLEKIIKKAKETDTIIRIGVNSGSFSDENPNKKDYEKIVDLALEYINFFETHNFNKLVISLKSSNPITTFEANKLFASKSNYPLHIGVTESGFDELGIVRSVSSLSPLLLDGIGNTIRISLTQNPIKEIETCKRLLHDLNLYDNYPTIISCPTCGRCKVNNVKKYAKEALKYCIKHKKYITVAVMGCIVNGIGEGKNADIGIAGADSTFIIFKKGQQIKIVNENNVLKELFKEIDSL